MSLSNSDIYWLICIDRFSKNEKQWDTEPLKNLVSPNLILRIDLLFKVMRRFLNTVQYTRPNREKFFKQSETLSFLLGMATIEMGGSPEHLFL